MLYHSTSQKVPLQNKAKNTFTAVFEAALALFSFYFFKQIVIREQTLWRSSLTMWMVMYIHYICCDEPKMLKLVVTVPLPNAQTQVLGVPTMGLKKVFR